MAVAMAGALLIAVGLPLLWLTQGHGDYTLDDPYIHLALAQRIAQGFYGLNPGESAAPSSSLLWPLLLTLLGAQRFAPLLINVACTLASAWLLGRLVGQWSWPQDAASTRRQALTLLLLLLAGNLIGLAYSGMEHSLQLLLTIACAYALQCAWQQREIPRACLLAAALGPAVRYELLSLLLLMATLLWLQQRRRDAVLLLLSGTLPLLGFALFLHAQGLPPLPGSVMVKEGLHGDGAQFLLQRLHEAWQDRRSIPLLLLGAACLWQAGAQRAQRRWMLLAAAGVAVAHLLCGRYGWFYRYEIYAALFLSLVLLISLQPVQPQRWRYSAYLLGMLALLYLPGTLLAPLSARNIYEQQYQMHRFVSLWWRRDVAANDIGWLAYGTQPLRVLDLVGLATPEAARPDKDAAWLQAIVARRKIGLVMIYPNWFGQVPAQWILLAQLRLGSRPIVVGGDTVNFYASSPQAAAELRPLLRDFAASLPAGPRLELR